jgi:hypothetical protein
MSRQSKAREWVIQTLTDNPGITPKRLYERKQWYFESYIEDALKTLVEENRARCINGRWFLIDINSKKDLDKACIV